MTDLDNTNVEHCNSLLSQLDSITDVDTLIRHWRHHPVVQPYPLDINAIEQAFGASLGCERHAALIVAAGDVEHICNIIIEATPLSYHVTSELFSVRSVSVSDIDLDVLERSHQFPQLAAALNEQRAHSTEPADAGTGALND